MQKRLSKLVCYALAIIGISAFIYEGRFALKDAWAQVQSVVGITTWGNNGNSAASITFRRWRSNIDDELDPPPETVPTQGAAWPEIQNLELIWGGGEGQWHRQWTASALGGTDGVNTKAFGMLVHSPGSLFNYAVSIGRIVNTPAAADLNVLAVGNTLYAGSADESHAELGGSGTNLSSVTSVGVPVSAPFATWSCVSAPAAGAQATCSRAAGGGTVRHVVTAWQACYVDTVTAVARHANLRDGATGAGTVLASSLLANSVANDSRCINNPPGYTKIGTANTAMTIEFDAAGAVTSEQTVFMSGYSVP